MPGSPPALPAIAELRVTKTTESMSARFLKWLPVVDEERCTGCGRCVEACGPKSLEILGPIAVLARPDTCGSEEHCIAPCPEKAIQMQWTELEGDQGLGKWRAAADIYSTRMIPSM